MSVIVLDASALVDALLDTERTERFVTSVAGADLIAPAHLKSEVLSAIGRLRRTEHFSENRATEAVTVIQRLPITQVGLDELLLDAWELRHNVSLTDALYVALARQREASLLTVDERLVAAAPDVARLPD